MTYRETVRKHARLAILRHLADSCEYTSNASILSDVLPALGLVMSRSKIITEIAWLRDQGFVNYDGDAGFIVVTATSDGVEIAKGITTHPEIQRPRAGS